ncbi:helix-turn-helix domain-containing protein [Labrys wisconsinensis]|uniref:AraC-like DNA-binding protein n=1 Tax=Labrys wisconsinensis TaxID=425677 RepID=A0ABU0JCI8_9HYPH|nr:helix-turn-helix domain-containing protein [Labrys wisconsinensis]MDQ0471999.1 AraC-like DNA-binding protein [Labrys wisconsinensis]
MVAVVYLRDRPEVIAARISASLAGAGAASAIVGAPGFPAEWHWWSLPLIALSASGPIAFWLWARVAFDDDFVFRPWYAGIWGALVGLTLAASCGVVTGAAASVLDRGLTFSDLGLAVLAVARTFATWRMDLVARRRRLRVAVLIGTLAYIAMNAAANLSSVAIPAWPSLVRNLADALGLCLLAALASWDLFRAATIGPALTPALAGMAADRRSSAPVKDDDRPAIEPALLNRLERLMTAERAYRREGLTIGSLAALMSLPEYRLRQVINEGLGHRNFNAFLNRYRIDEAKTALADAGQKDVPVLTIAMDAGFQSLGPFNRAFKADTGLTPTEFRRLALAKALSKPLSEVRNFEIGEPR